MALNNYHWITNRQTMRAAQPLPFRRSKINRPLEFGFEQPNFNGYHNYSYSRAYNCDGWDHCNFSHQNFRCASQPTSRQSPYYSQYEPHQIPQKLAWESSLEKYIKSEAEWTEKIEESLKKLNSNIDVLVEQTEMLQTRIAQQADASSCTDQGEDESVQGVGASNQNATALNQSEFNYCSHCAPASNHTKDNTPNKFSCIEEMVDDDFEEDSLDDLLQLILENSELFHCSSEVIEITQDLNSCLSLHPDSGAPALLECDSSEPALLTCDSSAPAALACDSDALGQLECYYTAPLACNSSAPAQLACDSDAPASLTCDLDGPASQACDSAVGADQIKNANIIDSLGDTRSKASCIGNLRHNEKNSGLKEKASDATHDAGDNAGCRDKEWCETKHESPVAEEDGPNHNYILEFLALDPGEKRVLISLAASSPI